jgi:hypothetical protein
MTFTTFERFVAMLLLAEGFALVFLMLGAIALWAMHRFPAKTPYPDTTLVPPGSGARRALLRQRSYLALFAATGLVLVLAATVLWYTLTWDIPFVPLWWVKWLVLLIAIFLLWGYGWLGLIFFRAYFATRSEWHANLAVGGVLKGFALSGHQVFHDVHVADLLVDHVVVGPKAVFLVNVAVRRRPFNIKDAVVKLLPVERQLDFGYRKEFEAVFGATRRVTEMSRVLEKLLGHKSRPLSAIVVPGWETAATEAGDHLLFNISNLTSLLSWARPQDGLLNEDIPAINKQMLAMAREERPV